MKCDKSYIRNYVPTNMQIYILIQYMYDVHIYKYIYISYMYILQSTLELLTALIRIWFIVD